MEGQIAVVQQQGGAVATLDSMRLGAKEIMLRKRVVQDILEQVMQEGVHYGKIPGCGDKASLLKPGAEAISSTFQLAPRYVIAKTDMGGGHREYEIVCDLYALSGAFVGSGVGSATTMEGKFRFRKAEQTCPQCGKNTIIKGKKEYGGGWLCYQKKGGCGAKFSDGDPTIENQNMGQIEHDNPADYYNTVLKMGKKRAFVDAILTTTGASDIFTQDIEDMTEVIPGAAKVQQNGFQAPQGMDKMPGDNDGFGPDPIDVELFTKVVAGMTMQELRDEWADEDFQLRYSVSDKKTIKAAFDKRLAELTKKAA